VSAARAEDDKIAADLKAAKEKYQAAVKKASEKLLASFAEQKEKLEKTTQYKPDQQMKLLRELEDERNAFVADPLKLPTFPALKVPTTNFQISEGAARRECEAAFDKAVKAYQNKKELEAAKKTALDKGRFFNNGQPPPPTAADKKLKMTADGLLKTYPKFYYYICINAYNERVIRATKDAHAKEPNGKHPDPRPLPVIDVLLDNFGGPASEEMVQQLSELFEKHNAAKKK
jgi:hypothetical protein